MPLRYPLALLALALGLAIPLVILLARGSGAPGRQFFGSIPPAGIVVPSFALRDQLGRPVTSDDLRGRAAAITFLDTRCREQCPVIASQIAQALRLLSPGDRARVQALAITVDPGHDTPASARAFLRSRRAARDVRFLLGGRRRLQPVWRTFGVLPVTGDADIHSAPVRVFDRTGVWVSTLSAGVDLTPGNLAHELRSALAD